ncbi:hypothetical protein [Paraburkholderia sediminicola]|uniref:hypothetical protein n=1 Tax=Paraburkholderia sediminicola TaxID=458836 RepID=UPI0038BDEB86
MSAALASCATTGKTLRLTRRATAYAITQTKVWDPTAHGIEFEAGATIDATGIPSPANWVAPTTGTWGAVAPVPAIWIRGVYNTGNLNPVWRTRVNELLRLHIMGAKNAGVVGLFFGDLPGSTTYGAAHITTHSMNVENFDIGVGFGSNAYIEDFHSPEVWNCNTCWFFPKGTTNAGENINIHGGATYDSGTGFDVSTAEFHLFGHSVDYCARHYIARGGASIDSHGGHTEGSGDGNYFAQSMDSLSLICLHNQVVFVTGNRTLELFNGQNSDGGVFLTGKSTVLVNGGLTYSPRTYISGYGDAPDEGYFNTTSLIRQKPYAQDRNILADGGFEDSANLTYCRADWRIINTSYLDWSLDTTHKDPASGTSSLKINPGTGRGVTLVKSVPCGPGAIVRLSGMLQGICSNATDSLSITVQYFDVRGQSLVSTLSGPTNTITFNQANVATYASFAEFAATAFTRAPVGTAFALITIATNASAYNGSSTWWLDNLILEVLGSGPGTRNDVIGAMSTFTPTINGTTTAGTASYSTRYANSWTIGDRCFFDAAIAWTDATGTGGLSVYGLPQYSQLAHDTVVSVSISGVPFTGPVVQARVGASSKSIKVMQVTAAGVESAVPISASGTIYVAGNFQIQY